MSEPLRTCLGCRRRAPQRALVRFAAVEGRLAAGRTLPGRGAYTCRSRACFEAALGRRAFARALRTTVDVRPPDAADYTGALDG
jgi:predicted RNA-binding protein YlxR (DUF448 family)